MGLTGKGKDGDGAFVMCLRSPGNCVQMNLIICAIRKKTKLLFVYLVRGPFETAQVVSV